MVRGLFGPVAGAVVVLGLAGACTEGGQSGPTPEPTPTVASPSPSASEAQVVKPERPEAMDRDDAEGGAAAAAYFISLYPYIMASSDTTEFESMSHVACGFCIDALEQARSIKERGELWHGGEITSALTEIYPRDELTGIFPYDFEVRQTAVRITARTGGEVFVHEPVSDDYRVEMGLQGGEWVVVGIVKGAVE